MKRRLRIAVLAGYLATGAIVLQLGPFCTMASSTATTGVAQSGFLIDPNGNFLGLVPVCGVPNIVVQREQADLPNDPIFEPIRFTEDDLMVGCPVQLVIIPAPPDEGG